MTTELSMYWVDLRVGLGWVGLGRLCQKNYNYFMGIMLVKVNQSNLFVGAYWLDVTLRNVVFYFLVTAVHGLLVCFMLRCTFGFII